MAKPDLGLEDAVIGYTNLGDGDLCSTSDMSTCVTASSPDLDGSAKSRAKDGEFTSGEASTDLNNSENMRRSDAELTNDLAVKAVCRNLSQLLESKAIEKALHDASLPASRELVYSDIGCGATDRLTAAQLVEDQLAAERSKVEHLKAKLTAAERLASERQIAERQAAERLAQAEARQAICEKQVTSERRCAEELRAELESVRAELEAKRCEVEAAGNVHKELRAREAQMVKHAQSLESLHQDATRQVEHLKFQHHILEVDLKRNKVQLETAADRQRILEEELRLLQEPLPMPASVAFDPVSRNAPAPLLARHGIASRAAFEQMNDARSMTADRPSGRPKKQPQSGSQSDASSWGCCGASAPMKPTTVKTK